MKELKTKDKKKISVEDIQCEFISLIHKAERKWFKNRISQSKTISGQYGE